MELKTSLQMRPYLERGKKLTTQKQTQRISEFEVNLVYMVSSSQGSIVRPCLKKYKKAAGEMTQ